MASHVSPQDGDACRDGRDNDTCTSAAAIIQPGQNTLDALAIPHSEGAVAPASCSVSTCAAHESGCDVVFEISLYQDKSPEKKTRYIRYEDNMSLVLLYQQVQEMFSVTTHIKLEYVHGDGDTITILSDDGLKEAVRMMRLGLPASLRLHMPCKRATEEMQPLHKDVVFQHMRRYVQTNALARVTILDPQILDPQCTTKIGEYLMLPVSHLLRGGWATAAAFVAWDQGEYPPLLIWLSDLLKLGDHRVSTNVPFQNLQRMWKRADTYLCLLSERCQSGDLKPGLTLQSPFVTHFVTRVLGRPISTDSACADDILKNANACAWAFIAPPETFYKWMVQATRRLGFIPPSFEKLIHLRTEGLYHDLHNLLTAAPVIFMDHVEESYHIKFTVVHVMSELARVAAKRLELMYAPQAWSGLPATSKPLRPCRGMEWMEYCIAMMLCSEPLDHEVGKNTLLRLLETLPAMGRPMLAIDVMQGGIALLSCRGLASGYNGELRTQFLLATVNGCMRHHTGEDDSLLCLQVMAEALDHGKSFRDYPLRWEGCVLSWMNNQEDRKRLMLLSRPVQYWCMLYLRPLPAYEKVLEIVALLHQTFWGEAGDVGPSCGWEGIYTSPPFMQDGYVSSKWRRCSRPVADTNPVETAELIDMWLWFLSTYVRAHVGQTTFAPDAWIGIPAFPLISYDTVLPPDVRNAFDNMLASTPHSGVCAQKLNYAPALWHSQHSDATGAPKCRASCEETFLKTAFRFMVYMPSTREQPVTVDWNELKTFGYAVSNACETVRNREEREQRRFEREQHRRKAATAAKEESWNDAAHGSAVALVARACRDTLAHIEAGVKLGKVMARTAAVREERARRQRVNGWGATDVRAGGRAAHKKKVAPQASAARVLERLTWNGNKEDRSTKAAQRLKCSTDARTQARAARAELATRQAQAEQGARDAERSGLFNPPPHPGLRHFRDALEAMITR